MALEGIDPDGLLGQQGLVVDIELAATGRFTYPDPVGGLVGSAAEAGVIDERLDQHRSVAVLRVPVRSESPRCPSQDGRCEIPAADPRQDQEAGIVDHPMQPLLTLRWRPADEAVARAGLPGSGAEAEQGEDTAAGADEVAQLRAAQWLIAEVVVALEVLIVQMGVLAMGDEVQLQVAQFAGEATRMGEAGSACGVRRR